MKKISIKNNKIQYIQGERITYHNFYRIRWEEDMSPHFMVRLKAKTKRKAHPGENDWDVFVIVGDTDDVYTQISEKITGVEYLLGMYSGEGYHVYKKRVLQETPFGVEYDKEYGKVEPIYLHELGVRQLQEIARDIIAVMDAGFGDHGRYHDPNETYKFCEKILVEEMEPGPVPRP